MNARPSSLSLPRLFAISVALFVAGTAAGAGSHRYEVTWREVSTTYTYDGHLVEGASRNLKFDVRQENATEVEFVLKWDETDDAVGLSKMDRFLLEAERPDGTPLDNSPIEGGDGYLRLVASRLNKVPAARSVEAGTIPELSKALAENRGDEGIGVWKIRVALRDVGNPSATPVDEGNGYVLHVTIRWYEPVVMRVVNLAPPGEMTVAQAVAGTPPLWLWATGLLGLASIGLGGLLVADTLRRRRRARSGER